MSYSTLLVEQMWLLEEGDQCHCGGRVGECGHSPFRRRFWTTANLPLRRDGVHEFVSVTKYNSNRQPVAADFVIDLDHVDNATVQQVYNTLSTYVERPLLYHSGNKGYHIVMPSDVLQLPSGNWQPAYRQFMDALKLPYDPSTFRFRALVRIAGSVHARTGYRKRLIDPEHLERAEDPQYVANYTIGSAELLRNALLDLQHSPSTQHPKIEDVWHRLVQIGTPLCIQKLYLDGLPGPGTRNQSYHLLASYYRSSGRDENSAKQMLTEFALYHNAHTQSSSRQRINSAIRTVESVYKHGHKFSCKEAATLGLCDSQCPLLT